MLATVRLSGMSSQKTTQPKATAVQPPSPLRTRRTQPYITAVVLRCNPSGDDLQCSFFLWEMHEPSARELTQRASPQPTTPPSTSTSTSTSSPGTVLYLPTPSTASPASTLPTLDDLPTRHRGKGAVTSPVAADDKEDDEDEGTLLSQIVARLSIDGFHPKPSTKEYLSQILREQIAINEAKVRTRDVTIARLSSKLDRLTVNKNVNIET